MPQTVADILVGVIEQIGHRLQQIADCVVAADEMPNFPHLELDKIGHFAMAKIKEAVLAVTGP